MRFDAIKAAQNRKVHKVKTAETPIPELYGSNVFSDEVMKNILSKEAYKSVNSSIKEGKSINREMASHVAAGLKRWALDKGATHYTHWFQPLTGSTAEKHDSFYDPDNGKAIEKFSAENLVQQEPDASSLPNGGLRNTFEARGYTAWDPSSPAFIYENTSGKTLCIPTVFVSYNGEALDYKAPLLKSINFVDKAATAVCKYFDTKITSCKASLGIEQEYFLVDEALFNARPDLMLCGRTLIGHAPAKGQQMDDHYFGSIPDRVFNYMYDFELEAIKLGIPLKTRHNEVAPGQYECAPMFEDVNLAIDHNLLLMDLMDEVARKHGFRVLFHEKPFAGINGSGKHNNWSLITNTGINLLSPGKDPDSNLLFLTIFINTIKAVKDNADIIRASIASASNDHRLGANEAPPAIISVFVGSTLTKVLKAFEQDKKSGTDGKERSINIDKIPEILADNTDRNRTSPFAFTGNKFELRAVGSTSNSAQPMTVLNSAVANQLLEFKDKVDARIKKGTSKKQAIVAELKVALKASKNILFEGNNYSDDWAKEAEKRGLSNIKNTPESLKAYVSAQAMKTFVNHGIFTKEELHARLEIMFEEYVKKIQIEGRVLADLVYTYVLPSAITYLSTLASNVKVLNDVNLKAGKAQHELIKSISDYIDDAKKQTDKMIESRKKANKMADSQKMAVAYHHNVKESFDNIRRNVDKLEQLVNDKLWQLPKYRELLFIK
ncbi:MAG: glutamine synthetase III [Bacteroidia bacterium]|nr:glutamine synthetase III [Bacteroidia bacterium]NNJ55719.1 glutamine synthetase type III [Bacteroidia bacterium]